MMDFRGEDGALRQRDLEDDDKTRSFAHILTLMIAVAFIGFIVWAHQAVLDEVTRGEGRVIPSSKIQTVQHLEGGIVAEILTEEGAAVEKGQVLLRIDNVEYESIYRDQQQKLLSLLASVARMEAELADSDQLTFPEEVVAEAPELVEAETNIFITNRDQLETQVEILSKQVEQAKQRVAETTSRLQHLKSSYPLVARELGMLERLAADGTVAQMDVLRKKREANDLAAELSAAELALPRERAALNEAESRIAEKRNAVRIETAQKLSEAKVKLKSVQESLTAGRDKVTRTEVRAPVKGTVKQLLVRTIGGVVKPGQDIVEIVPIEDKLLIEASIRPSDVAFLVPGQKAMVKITAYDFSIYGGLDAKLEQISADSIEDPALKESFFKIYLRTDKSALTRGQEELPIIPGMTAQVEILTGKKTVLDYMLKPIIKARDSALRER